MVVASVVASVVDADVGLTCLEGRVNIAEGRGGIGSVVVAERGQTAEAGESGE